jgi:D-ribose pyranase
VEGVGLMKKTTLLNAEISRVVADMGHGDYLVIADAGLPVPPGAVKIDLAVKPGVPTFLEVLEAILSELEIEEVTIASEMKDKSPDLYREMKARFDGIMTEISHEEFKSRLNNVKAIIRTGEFKPFANIALRSGVVF